MNLRDCIASLFLLIGGIFSIIPVLPINNNLFPIYIIKVGPNAPDTGYVSFWSIMDSKWGLLPIYNTFKWTSLSISPLVLILIFATLGILGLIFSANIFLDFLPSNKVKNIPITSLIGSIAGIINIFFDLLIFYGNALDDSKNGLSVPKDIASYFLTWNVVIGLGYWLLVLSGILIISGSMINGIPKNLALSNKKAKNLKL